MRKRRRFNEVIRDIVAAVVVDVGERDGEGSGGEGEEASEGEEEDVEGGYQSEMEEEGNDLFG
jgi:hypothetical protein